MIDWLSMVAPLHHSTPITGGHVVSIKSTGEVDWQCTKRTTVEGSFSTGLQVRTAEHESDQPCTHIEVSGNPVKFFRGTTCGARMTFPRSPLPRWNTSPRHWASSRRKPVAPHGATVEFV
jgi:hypothetical protein